MTLYTYPGAPESNSFITVEEAAAILGKYYMADKLSTWTDLSDTLKELFLEQAVHIMEDSFAFRGYRTYYYQALCFPRTGCPENIGFDKYNVPQPVKEAQALIAYEVAYRGYANRPDIEDETGNLEISSMSVGGLSFSTTGAKAGAGDSFEEFINDSFGAIKTLLNRFSAQIRGGAVKRQYKLYLSSTTTTSTTSTSTTSTTSTITTSTT